MKHILVAAALMLPVPQTATAATQAPETTIIADGEGGRARAQALIRIGEDGIARENDAALNAYFSEDFRFHGPEGDTDLNGLKATFAAMRVAFSNFQVRREMIIVQGDYVASRTSMTGMFTHPLSSPKGIIQPTGKPMTRNLINIFRFDAQGRLAEEWVQYDSVAFMRQLGLEPVPNAKR